MARGEMYPTAAQDVSLGNAVDPRREWEQAKKVQALAISGSSPGGIKQIEERKQGLLKRLEAERANDTKGRESDGRLTARVRKEARETGVLRADQQGQAERDGHENGAQVQSPTLLQFSAKNKPDLEKQIRKATKGKSVISRTDRMVYTSVVVIE